MLELIFSNVQCASFLIVCVCVCVVYFNFTICDNDKYLLLFGQYDRVIDGFFEDQISTLAELTYENFPLLFGGNKLII